MGRATLHRKDVREALASVEDASFDACLTDPPYGIGFMGRAWDHGVPSVKVWSEVLRVLKPGAFLMAFGGTRTHHRLMCAIEDAGFEIRDCLMWLYGSGFHKSLDISKAIDKASGAQRERVGRKYELGVNRDKGEGNKRHDGYDRPWRHDPDAEAHFVTLPATPAARIWAGYGTALKPAWEPIILAMKSLDGTFAANALEHGVAGLNVDGGRLATSDKLGGGAELYVQADKPDGWDRPWRNDPEAQAKHAERIRENVATAEAKGRWPPNLLFSHTPFCREVGVKRVRGSSGTRGGTPESTGRYGGSFPRGDGRATGYADRGGLETILAFDCHPLCAVRMLDEQAGERPGFTGGGRSGRNNPPERRPSSAFRTLGDDGNRSYHRDMGGGPSRFLYCAKVSAEERSASKHPTLKPVDLTSYLARLLLPPSRAEPRRLLVPFCGAGSEIIGSFRAGWEEAVGIDDDSDGQSVEDAERRIVGDQPLFNQATSAS